MALEYRAVHFGLGPTTKKEMVAVHPVDFGRPVNRAEVALKGFISRFDSDDHELYIHKIRTYIDRIEGSKVYVKIIYLLRDHSGNIDDSFSGVVDVLVFADVAPQIRPPVFFGKASARTRGGGKRRARAR